MDPDGWIKVIKGRHVDLEDCNKYERVGGECRGEENEGIFEGENLTRGSLLRAGTVGPVRPLKWKLKGGLLGGPGCFRRQGTLDLTRRSGLIPLAVMDGT